MTELRAYDEFINFIFNEIERVLEREPLRAVGRYPLGLASRPS